MKEIPIETVTGPIFAVLILAGSLWDHFVGGYPLWIAVLIWAVFAVALVHNTIARLVNGRPLLDSGREGDIWR